MPTALSPCCRHGPAGSRGAVLLALLLATLAWRPVAAGAQGQPPRDTAAASATTNAATNAAARDSARRIAVRDSLRAIAVRDSARADSTRRLMFDRLRARPVPPWLWVALSIVLLAGIAIVVAGAQGVSPALIDTVGVPVAIAGVIALMGLIFLGGVELGARRAIGAALAAGRIVPPAELPATWPVSMIALLFGVLAVIATVCFFAHASRGSWLVESHWGGFGSGGGGTRVSATLLYFVSALVFAGLALVVSLRSLPPTSTATGQAGTPATSRPTPTS